MTTQCSICYNVLKRTAKFLEDNEQKRERINLFIEEEYTGIQVLHLLELLRDELGFEALQDHVVQRLEGLSVAPYYGCLLLRPQNEIGLDDPDEPTILQDLLVSIGCGVVDFSHKTECCGSYLTVTAAQAAKELARGILGSALAEGAEMIVTSCPLCQFNLDYRQQEMSQDGSGFAALPVLYFTQLLGIALGLDSTDYGFEQHYVDPRPLLVQNGLIA
jgi:heterodisulfide reductase subunit B